MTTVLPSVPIRADVRPLLVQKAHELHALGARLVETACAAARLAYAFALWFVSFCHRTHWLFSVLLFMLALTLVLFAWSRPMRKGVTPLARLREARAAGGGGGGVVVVAGGVGRLAGGDRGR